MVRSLNELKAGKSLSARRSGNFFPARLGGPIGFGMSLVWSPLAPVMTMQQVVDGRGQRDLAPQAGIQRSLSLRRTTRMPPALAVLGV